MSYIWALLLIAAPVLIWKLTSPEFLVALVFAATKGLFSSKAHSKEYWDVVHELTYCTDKMQREVLQDKLKELRSKGA